MAAAAASMMSCCSGGVLSSRAVQQGQLQLFVLPISMLPADENICGKGDNSELLQSGNKPTLVISNSHTVGM